MEIEKLGTSEDLLWAEQFVRENVSHNRTVYASLPVGEKQVFPLSCQNISQFMILPCLWPYLIIGCPYFTVLSMYNRRRAQALMAIVTDVEVIQVIRDFKYPCAPCCSPGVSVKIIPLDQIASVEIDNRGRNCSCCIFSFLKLGTTGNNGFTVEQAKLHAGQNPVVEPKFCVASQVTDLLATPFIVENPNDLLKMINKFREGKMKATGDLYPATKAPGASNADDTGASSSNQKRIFVSRNGSKDSIIIMLKPGVKYQEVQQLIAMKLDMPPGTQFKIKLKAEGIEVTDFADLQNNDSIEVTNKS